ncbi:MAG: hypothetical protein ACOCX5_05810 [Chloroflexota bacterium]
MPTLHVVAHAVKLTGAGGVGVPGKTNHDGQIDTLGDKPEHHFDPLEIGFEIVERRAKTRGEDFAASLTLEARDMIMMTVADERMNSIIGDDAVATVGVWVGEAVCVNGCLASARAFDLMIGDDIA